MTHAEEALVQIFRSLNPRGLRMHGSKIHRRIYIALIADGLVEMDSVYLSLRLTPEGVEAVQALLAATPEAAHG